MTVEAVITWEDGTTETLQANGFIELFDLIGERKIKRVDAYEIRREDLRQGRSDRFV